MRHYFDKEGQYLGSKSVGLLEQREIYYKTELTHGPMWFYIDKEREIKAVSLHNLPGAVQMAALLVL